MTSPVTAPLKPIVNAVVERAVTAANEITEEPVTSTMGVEEYAEAKVRVQAVAAVPVVMTPATSFEPEAIEGLVPQVESTGVARVLEAVRCPY